MKRIYVLLVLFLASVGTGATANASSFADIVFVVDQSGSMNSEFSWISNSISTIAGSISDAGIFANYGIAGYEDTTGSQKEYNAWVDLTSDISAIVDEADRTYTYGGTEYAYSALDWSVNNFSWTGGDYAKVVIFITDEDPDDKYSYTYNDLTGEAAIAKLMADENILLNVISLSSLEKYWDDVVYSTSDGYSGYFDLSYLRNCAAAFTEEFTEAKIKEIQNYNPVPEPSTVLLLGVGIIFAAGGLRRKTAC